MSHRKRKHRQRSDIHNNQYDPVQPSSSSSSTRPDHSLFIVAHEADIIRGPQAARSADSLEVGINVDGLGGSRVGEGLIKWETDSSSKVGDRDAEGDDRDMCQWVDRYVTYLYRIQLEYTPSGVQKESNPVFTVCSTMRYLMVRFTNSLYFCLPSPPFRVKTLHRSRTIISI
jgi:hypothetical protein